MCVVVSHQGCGWLLQQLAAETDMATFRVQLGFGGLLSLSTQHYIFV